MLLATEKQGDDSSANGSNPVKKSVNETFNDFFNKRVRSR
jgi:hypothetical protein